MGKEEKEEKARKEEKRRKNCKTGKDEKEEKVRKKNGKICNRRTGEEEGAKAKSKAKGNAEAKAIQSTTTWWASPCCVGCCAGKTTMNDANPKIGIHVLSDNVCKLNSLVLNRLRIARATQCWMNVCV